MVNHLISRSHASTAAFWKQQLQQQQASGLSVATFCRVRDLGPASFYSWRRRLVDLAAPPASFFSPVPPTPTPTPTLALASAVEATRLSWCEVSLASAGAAVDSRSTDMDSDLEEPPGRGSRACSFKIGSAGGLVAEFSQFPSQDQLTAICRALHPVPPPVC